MWQVFFGTILVIMGMGLSLIALYAIAYKTVEWLSKPKPKHRCECERRFPNESGEKWPDSFLR